MTLIAEKAEALKREILDFYQGEVTQRELDSILNNPEKALENANITVDDIFKEAVISGLKEANQTYFKFHDQPCLWNNQLLLDISQGSDLFFTKKPWGLVLELSHNATQYAIYGISLTASISSAIKGVVNDLPIANVTENIVVTSYATYLSKSATYINTIDQGNGIYLVLTWPQIALSAGVLLPTPTTVAR